MKPAATVSCYDDAVLISVGTAGWVDAQLARRRVGGMDGAKVGCRAMYSHQKYLALR